jgi:hypothetical protein
MRSMVTSPSATFCSAAGSFLASTSPDAAGCRGLEAETVVDQSVQVRPFEQHKIDLVTHKSQQQLVGEVLPAVPGQKPAVSWTARGRPGRAAKHPMAMSRWTPYTRRCLSWDARGKAGSANASRTVRVAGSPTIRAGTPGRSSSATPAALPATRTRRPRSAR